MSDNWIKLIPDDPSFIPDPANQARARERFAEIAADADEIELKVCAKIECFDCGENFEHILCPSCRAEILVSWGQERMNEDYKNGFLLAKYAVPCCHTLHSMHELRYEGPQGFGRFALSAMNPSIGRLEDRYKQEFEEILGTKLCAIYQRL